MSAKTANEKIIFGLKVKQLRQEQGLSFSDLSKTSGMSLSYLNEIEKGKKFPKQDKVKNLAKALGTTREELTDGKLGRHLAPVTQLLQSNFLNELPLELFGIELSKVADLIAQAPTRVGAFNFYFAALRSYLELHDNYFPELEEAVETFTHKHSLPGFRPVPPRTLGGLLESGYGYTIVPDGLNDHPDLQIFRSVYQPEKKQLLLNGNLTPGQRGFQYGKELAFNYLRLTERANTSSLLRSRVFEEVLNHSKATYFSVALHIPLHPFVESVRQFFASPNWDGSSVLGIMQRYNATPEMFYHRLTNILPKFFGLRELFFLRFLHECESDDFTIDKELHLHRRHHPHENGLFEHYCRRWVSLSLLEEAPSGDSSEMRIDVQRSHYYGTEDEYLCITLARMGSPEPGRNVSLTIGLLVNDKLKETISWLDDPAIPTRIVNNTCERCPITDCAERAAAPVIVNKRDKYQRVKAALKEL